MRSVRNGLINALSILNLLSPLNTYAQGSGYSRAQEQQTSYQTQGQPCVLPTVVVAGARLEPGPSKYISYLTLEKEKEPTPLSGIESKTLNPVFASSIREIEREGYALKKPELSKEIEHIASSIRDIERAPPREKETVYLRENLPDYESDKIKTPDIRIVEPLDPILVLLERDIPKETRTPNYSRQPQERQRSFSPSLETPNRNVERPQSSRQTDLPVYQVSGITVQAERIPEQEEFIPHIREISNYDLGTGLSLEHVEATSPLPGATNNLLYKDAIFDSVYEIKKKILLLRTSNGFGTGSALPSHNLRATIKDWDPRHSALGFAVLLEDQTEEGIDLYFHPLRWGISAGRVREKDKESISAEYLYPPKFISEKLKSMGEGPRIRGTLGVGNKTQASWDFYWQKTDVDLSDVFNTVYSYIEKNRSMWNIGTLEHHFTNFSLRASIGNQKGSTEAYITKNINDNARVSRQGIDFTSGDISLENRNTEFRVNAYTLKRSDPNGFTKKVSGLQIGIDRKQYVPKLEVLAQGNVRLDLTKEASPRVSLFGSLEKEIGNFNIGIKARHIYDHFTFNGMGEPAAKLDPALGNSPQEIFGLTGHMGFRTGCNEFTAEAEFKNNLLQFFLPGSHISGITSRLTYRCSTNRFIAQATAVYRPLKMTLGEEEMEVPGSSKAEFNGMIGFKGNSSFVGASLSIRKNYNFPYQIDKESGGKIKNLGQGWFLNSYYSQRLGSWSLNLTINNWLKLLNLWDSKIAYHEDQDGGSFFSGPGFFIISAGKHFRF